RGTRSCRNTRRSANKDPPLHLGCRSLIPPKPTEWVGRQCGVARRMIQAFVPEVELNMPRRLAIVRQLVAAAMSQHVDMNRELEPGRLPGLFDDPLRGAPAQRLLALAFEHE